MMPSLNEIKQRRQRISVTQQELAKFSGVSQSLITKVESGILDPSYTNAEKIFSALDQLEQKKSIKAAELMNTKLVSLSLSSSLKDAVKKMKKHGISQLPVFEGERCVGLVTESTLLDAVVNRVSTESTVASLLQEAPPTVDQHATKELIAGLLRHYPIVLIGEKGKIKGFITKADLLFV